jgi:hypothetical protein
MSGTSATAETGSAAGVAPVAVIPIPVIINTGDPQMSSLFDQAQLLTRLWVDFATRMVSAGMRSNGSASPPDAARAVRTGMFEAMSQMFDQYMRSPQALELVKQSMDMAINFRKQRNDMLTRIHHETQGTAKQDIDSLMLNVRHLETRVLDCLEAMTARLDAIGRRLDTLEASAHQGNGEKPHSPERPPRRPAREKPEKVEE